VSADARPAASLDRAWLLRALIVLQAPQPVFFALREDDDEAAHARQEPLLALCVLAGVGGVLATSVAGRLLDDPALDNATVAVWAFLGGAVYGLAAYWIVGGFVYGAARGLGGLGSYRRARHVVGFAAAPLALSVLVLWPLGLAVFGSDLFRTGGSDTGTAGELFEAVQLAFVGWSIVLLVIGVRAVQAWSWARAAGTVAIALAPVALLIVAERL
jgi:hypothetical protein